MIKSLYKEVFDEWKKYYRKIKRNNLIKKAKTILEMKSIKNKAEVCNISQYKGDKKNEKNNLNYESVKGTINDIKENIEEIQIKNEGNSLNEKNNLNTEKNTLSTKKRKSESIETENLMLKRLFLNTKRRVEMKRNTVFINPDTQEIKVKETNKEEVLIKEKDITNINKEEHSIVLFNLIKEDKENPICITEQVAQKEPQKKQMEITKNIEPTKKHIESLNQINKYTTLCSTNHSLIKHPMYDVKTSKFIKDSLDLKPDLYKRVIDKQRRLVQNEYKSSTVIPHIQSDEEDSMVFIKPFFALDPQLNKLVCLQTHEELELYFDLCKEINVEELFPGVRDVTNDSPNKWV